MNLTWEKVENVWCEVCKEYKTQIMSCKTFSNSWIKGLKNPVSDAVKKHVTPEIHEHAVNLALKRELRPKTMTMYANIGSSGSQLYYNKKIFTTAYCIEKHIYNCILFSKKTRNHLQIIQSC